MAIEIVDFPIENGDFPWFFVCLPEGIVPNPTSHAPDHIPGLSADLLVFLVKIPKKIARYILVLGAMLLYKVSPSCFRVKYNVYIYMYIYIYNTLYHIYIIIYIYYCNTLPIQIIIVGP